MISNKQRAVLVTVAAISGSQLTSLLTVQSVGQSVGSECPPSYQEGYLNQMAEHAALQLRNNYHPGALNEWVTEKGEELRSRLSGHTELVPISGSSLVGDDQADQTPAYRAAANEPLYSGSRVVPRPGDPNYSPTDAAAGLYNEVGSN
jgi:hypothetical protein